MADTDDNDEGDIDPSLAEAAEGDEVDGGGKKNDNNDEVSTRPLLVHQMFAFAFAFAFVIRVTDFTWPCEGMDLPSFKCLSRRPRIGLPREATFESFTAVF